ncbi:MAG: hypothetical protein KKH01_06165 [Firmicutes bacterium]|nr:hypothetical protein [Bacillota bacterium]
MPREITIVIVVITFFVLLLFGLNYKIARENEAHVLERLGGFYKIVYGPAIFFNIPLVQRVVQVVPLNEQKLQFKIEDTESKSTQTIYLRYKIVEIKLFVYTALDSIKELKNYIISHITPEIGLTEDIKHIIREYAEDYGIEIIELWYK